MTFASQNVWEAPFAQRKPTALTLRPNQLALRVAWLIPMLVICATIGGAIAFQQSIIASWPSSKQIYEVAGLAQEPIDEGLVIIDLQYAYSSPEILRVTGKLTNLTTARLEIPSMKVRMFDRLGIVVMTRKFFLSEKAILSDEVIKFSTEIRHPPASAERIEVGISNQ
ncbi:MAG: hypothetical protein VYA17_04895 [Pseudomonadota bacterium]|nr:hypothetical protein [Pseudomonadota bacterium]